MLLPVHSVSASSGPRNAFPYLYKRGRNNMTLLTSVHCVIRKFLITEDTESDDSSQAMSRLCGQNVA